MEQLKDGMKSKSCFVLLSSLLKLLFMLKFSINTGFLDNLIPGILVKKDIYILFA